MRRREQPSLLWVSVRSILRALYATNHLLQITNNNRKTAIVEQIENETFDGSHIEDKSYLLGTFFRDFSEEQQLAALGTDDQSKSDKTESNNLRDDVTIFDMLLTGADVSICFLPDRVEIRSLKPRPIC